MKKFIILLIAVVGFFVSVSAQMTVLNSNTKYVAALDTLTNTDTTIQTLTIPGGLKTVTWIWNQTKISGTVTQSWKVYGGLNVAGTVTYTTYAIDSITGSNNASNIYSKQWTNNPFTNYKIIVLSSGTQVTSQRTIVSYKQ